jgi:hypothetical protein
MSFLHRCPRWSGARPRRADNTPFSSIAGARRVDCILLANLRMPSTRCRIPALASAGILLHLAAAPAIAQPLVNDATPPPPHVRPEHGVRALVEEAARRSPVIRDLIDQLEALDVTVYVRARVFAQSDLEGHVALLASAGGHRYLMIELACGRPEITQMATLGHELFHALEIASEPSIVDTRTLATFYARTGMETSNTAGRRTFETAAAAAAGQRARRELLTITTRHRNGT